MAIPSPFHTRTLALNESWQWQDWAGYLAATVYEPVSHEREYFAIRNSVALIDVSPLFKYEVSGPDAARLLDRIMTRDLTRCRVGQVLYSPWCDEAGKILDDGTISRLDEQRFRVTSAHPNLRWFQDAGEGLDARVVDVTRDMAALAIQGPKSGAVLGRLFPEAGIQTVPYFGLAHAAWQGSHVAITRTGYTGDLGYELWLAPEQAGPIWDALFAIGQDYALLPAGLAALDVARIEAGLPLIEVDYIPARRAILEEQKSSPFELGLGWTVHLDGDNFIGQAALRAEKQRGSRWAFVGLQVSWFELERLFNAAGLRPPVAGKRASRRPLPIYDRGRQVGQATSHVFSPLLKRYLALASVEKSHAALGQELEIEFTVEYRRERARATVTTLPFFDPPRKRA